MSGFPASNVHQDLLAYRATNNLVTINVSDGALHKAYHLDKDLLCRVSPVFSTGFQGSSGGAAGGYWKETNEMEMKWPECSPRIFDIFIGWLYTSQLPSDSALQLLRDIEFPLLHLLVLADRAMITALQQKCYDRIRYHLQLSMVPSKLFVQELYSIGLLNDKLRRYVARLFVCLVFRGRLRMYTPTGTDPLDELVGAIPEFALDMIKGLRAVAETANANLSEYQKALVRGSTPRVFAPTVPCADALCPVHPFNDPEFKVYADA